MTDYPGTLHPGFGGPGLDWFNSVTLLPRAGLDFGSIASQTDKRFELFSAWRSNVSLATFNNHVPASVSVPDLPGLPYTIQPFCSLRDPASSALNVLGMIARATAATPAPFSSTLDFGLDVDSLMISVTGVSLAFVALEFDGDSVTERLSWSTDFIVAAGGIEQRIARRENPRQSFDVGFVLEGADRRKWASILFGIQTNQLALPLWQERIAISAAVSGGAFTVTVPSTSYIDLRVGGYAALYADAATFDVLQIASKTSTTVTFTSATANAYPAGSDLVPVRFCYVEATVRSGRPPFTIEKFTARFESIDNDTGAPAGDNSAFTQLSSKPIVDDPNVIFGQEAQQSSTRAVYVIDNLSGNVYHVSDWDRSKRGSTLGASPKTRAALWRMRQLLISLRGRQVSFWAPTFADDLIPTANLSNGVNTLQISNCGYSRYVGSRQPRATIRVTFTDATQLVRTIISASELSAADEQLVVNTTWPATKTPSQVSRIEFLEHVRLDADDIEIKYDRVGKATIQAPLMAIADA